MLNMFGDDRTGIRRVFQMSWRKHQDNQTLNGIEAIIAQVIHQHPEYHALLGGDPLDKDFPVEAGESNPFLHMGMHITLAEQLAADRPRGIRKLHQKISRKVGDIHQAEHDMMECLGAVLWEAQMNKRMPDEQVYLQCLKKIAVEK